MAKKSKIRIKKANRGAFTAKAKAAGMSVQEYAAHVLSKNSNASAATRKQANFARNAASWKKPDGGPVMPKKKKRKKKTQSLGGLSLSNYYPNGGPVLAYASGGTIRRLAKLLSKGGKKVDELLEEYELLRQLDENPNNKDILARYADDPEFEITETLNYLDAEIPTVIASMPKKVRNKAYKTFGQIQTNYGGPRPPRTLEDAAEFNFRHNLKKSTPDMYGSYSGNTGPIPSPFDTPPSKLTPKEVQATRDFLSGVDQRVLQDIKAAGRYKNKARIEGADSRVGEDIQAARRYSLGLLGDIMTQKPLKRQGGGFVSRFHDGGFTRSAGMSRFQPAPFTAKHNQINRMQARHFNVPKMQPGGDPRDTRPPAPGGTDPKDPIYGPRPADWGGTQGPNVDYSEDNDTWRSDPWAAMSDPGWGQYADVFRNQLGDNPLPGGETALKLTGQSMGYDAATMDDMMEKLKGIKAMGTAFSPIMEMWNNPGNSQLELPRRVGPNQGFYPMGGMIGMGNPMEMMNKFQQQNPNNSNNPGNPLLGGTPPNPMQNGKISGMFSMLTGMLPGAGSPKQPQNPQNPQSPTPNSTPPVNPMQGMGQMFSMFKPLMGGMGSMFEAGGSVTNGGYFPASRPKPSRFLSSSRKRNKGGQELLGELEVDLSQTAPTLSDAQTEKHDTPHNYAYINSHVNPYSRPETPQFPTGGGIPMAPGVSMRTDTGTLPVRNVEYGGIDRMDLPGIKPLPEQKTRLTSDYFRQVEEAHAYQKQQEGVQRLPYDSKWEYKKDGDKWKARQIGNKKWITAKGTALTAIKEAFGEKVTKKEHKDLMRQDLKRAETEFEKRLKREFPDASDKEVKQMKNQGMQVIKPQVEAAVTGNAFVNPINIEFVKSPFNMPSNMNADGSMNAPFATPGNMNPDGSMNAPFDSTSVPSTLPPEERAMLERIGVMQPTAEEVAADVSARELAAAEEYDRLYNPDNPEYNAMATLAQTDIAGALTENLGEQLSRSWEVGAPAMGTLASFLPIGRLANWGGKGAMAGWKWGSKAIPKAYKSAKEGAQYGSKYARVNTKLAARKGKKKVKEASKSIGDKTKELLERAKQGDKEAQRMYDQAMKRQREAYGNNPYDDIFKSEPQQMEIPFAYGGTVPYMYGGPIMRYYQDGGALPAGPGQAPGQAPPAPEPIQAEKGEKVLFEDGMITDVHAKKNHQQMVDNHITDILPPGSFIASKRPYMKISKKEAGGALVGVTPIMYEEGTSGRPPKEITMAGLMHKSKMTPAEYAQKLTSYYPITDRMDDPFSSLAVDENKYSRLPYIEGLRYFTEKKKEQGDRMGSTSRQYPYGGPIYSHTPEKAFWGAIVGGGLDLIKTTIGLVKGAKDKKLADERFDRNEQAIANASAEQRSYATQGAGVNALAQLAAAAQNPQVEAANMRKSLGALEAMPDSFNPGLAQNYLSRLERQAAALPLAAHQMDPTQSSYLNSGQANALYAQGDLMNNLMERGDQMKAQKLGALSQGYAVDAQQRAQALNQTNTNINQLRGNLFSNLGSIGANHFNQLGNISSSTLAANMQNEALNAQERAAASGNQMQVMNAFNPQNVMGAVDTLFNNQLPTYTPPAIESRGMGIVNNDPWYNQRPSLPTPDLRMYGGKIIKLKRK